MAMLLARILGGIFSSFGGVFFLYEFLSNLSKGSNLLFLLLFLVLIALAVFLLITGAKIAELIVSGKEVIDPKKQASDSLDGLEKILQRNNSITAEWSKTQKTRDEIKLLEVQANAEKGA